MSFYFLFIITMSTTKKTTWLYVIKNNSKEWAEKPYITNLVLATQEWVELMKSQMWEVPFDELYWDFIEYKDWKNVCNKQHCLEFKSPKWKNENEIKKCIEWNNEKLKD